MDKVFGNLRDGTPPNHHLAGLHSGKLPFTLQCDLHSKEVTPISIHPDYLDHHIMIGTELTDELRSTLTNFLKGNLDVLAWLQGDVPGIDPQVAMHRLFTNPEHPPVRQKRRKFAPERLKVIDDEVNKLIEPNVIGEAHYPEWLANIVVAPKN